METTGTRPIDYHGYGVLENGTILSKITEKPMNPSCNGKGYLITTFRINGIPVTRAVHAVVCEAFHGPRPPGHEVDHIDNDRTNNHKGNLQWLTKSANNQKTWDSGNKDNTGTNNGRATLTEEDVLYIRSLPLKHGMFSKLGREYGVAHSCIRNAYYGKSWTHLPR